MQEKLEATLASLISIPSESRNRDACCEIIEFVRSELQPLGLFIHCDTERESPYLIATTQSTKQPYYLLAAHLDVVPAHPSQFTLTTVEDRLFGRGTLDMKFAAACFIEFAKQHQEQLKDLDIGFLFTTDEELGGETVPEILEAGWRPKIAFLPDGGIGWKIEARAKGYRCLEVTALGKTAHASRPAEGDNAIYKLLPFATQLRKRFPLKLASDATMAITTIQGGETWNQIPDQVMMTVDFRSFDMQELDDFYNYSQALAEKYGLSCTSPNQAKPLKLNQEHSDVSAFAKALEATTGEPVEYTESFGATDGRWFAPYDIQSIIIQPHGGGHHSPNEWVLRTDLEKYYQLLRNWLIPDNL